MIGFRSRRLLRIAALFFALILVAVLSFGFFRHRAMDARRSTVFRYGSHSNRKLLSQGEEVAKKPNRVGESCSKDDVVVYQGATSPLPNGIPTYTVEVLNECSVSGCSIARIHLSCGWFSSARLVNPRLFRRLRFNDCLLNDGRPLPAGSSLSFQYANSFPYPISVSSASCL